MIVALAGRRVDGVDAKERRFPLGNVEMVRTRMRALLQEKGATALVSSAACGSDLIALSEAGQLGLRRVVILPFERRRFRETSVTDRPGNWGSLYDETLNDVDAADDLFVLEDSTGDDEGFSTANRAILDRAVELAKDLHQRATAVLIWDGASYGDHDLTEEFGVEARKRALTVTEVLTI